METLIIFSKADSRNLSVFFLFFGVRVLFGVRVWVTERLVDKEKVKKKLEKSRKEEKEKIEETLDLCANYMILSSNFIANFINISTYLVMEYRFKKQVFFKLFLHTTATRIHKGKCVDLACHQQYRLYFSCSINFALITDLRTILGRVYRNFAIICYGYIFDVTICLFSPSGIKYFPVLSYFSCGPLIFSVVSYFSINLLFCRRSLFFVV